MLYAIIKSGGKQFRVTEGDVIEVEKLAAKPNDVYTFTDVLLYVADGKFQIGNPLLKNIIVSGRVLEQLRSKKVRVGKYKAKVRFRRVTGHRQSLTKIKIEKIGDTKTGTNENKSIKAKNPIVLNKAKTNKNTA